MNETECPRLCSEHGALLIKSDAQNMDDTLAGCLPQTFTRANKQVLTSVRADPRQEHESTPGSARDVHP